MAWKTISIHYHWNGHIISSSGDLSPRSFRMWKLLLDTAGGRRVSHRVMASRHERGAWEVFWQDLVTLWPQKTEQAEGCQKKLTSYSSYCKTLPSVFTRKTGKVEGKTHRQACGGFLPILEVPQLHLLCCFAHLPVAFCLLPEGTSIGRRQESFRIELQPVSSSVSPSIPFHSAQASYHLGLLTLY